nr:DUF4358 domain-containing protein [bacterium]
MKKLVVFALSIALLTASIIAFSACGNPAATPGPGDNLTSQYIADTAWDKLAAKLGEDNITQKLQTPDSFVDENYPKLPKDKLKDYAIYNAMAALEAFEFAVFTLNNAGDADKVTEACQTRAAQIADIFKSYLVEQAQYAQNPTIERIGNHIVFIVGPEANELLTCVKEVMGA